MQSKSFLIAVAAFAVTATGVHAHSGTKLLSRAGLDDDQVVAIQEAQQLRKAGELDAARDKLIEAGITEDTLRSIHAVAKESRTAVHEAVENEDYEAFKVAIANSPLADIVTSEADFKQFVEAHSSRQAGEWEEAEALFADLGIEHSFRHHHHGRRGGWHSQLNSDQLEALRVAKAANDRATIQAILDEAGAQQYRD